METMLRLRPKRQRNKFKSYYVVWKPDLGAPQKYDLVVGLNRTM